MDDGLVGVDVLQIGVQGVDALLQALLQFVVFVGFDNARHRVVREQPVMVFAVLVDAETHTVAGQLSIDRFATVYQFMGQSACCGFDHRACSLLWRLLWLQAVRRFERTLTPQAVTGFDGFNLRRARFNKRARMLQAGHFAGRVHLDDRTRLADRTRYNEWL